VRDGPREARRHGGCPGLADDGVARGRQRADGAEDLLREVEGELGCWRVACYLDGGVGACGRMAAAVGGLHRAIVTRTNTPSVVLRTSTGYTALAICTAEVRPDWWRCCVGAEAGERKWMRKCCQRPHRSAHRLPSVATDVRDDTDTVRVPDTKSRSRNRFGR
jgi:hypothetical protein